jgi:AMP deaminase
LNFSVQYLWKFIEWCFLFMVEIPTADEIEVFKILQKCLELRDSYLFREEVAPWEKEVINDPCTPKPNPNPFTYVPEPKSEVP